MTRILGIDPGSQRTGIGIIDADAGGATRHVFHTALDLLGNDTFPLRLKQIFDEVCALIAVNIPRDQGAELTAKCLGVNHGPRRAGGIAAPDEQFLAAAFRMGS